MIAIRHGLIGVLIATIAIDLVIAVGTFGLEIPVAPWHGLLGVLALLWLIILIQGVSLARNKELARVATYERALLQSYLDASPLRQSEEHFRLLAENVQDTIFRYDLLPEPRLTYVSPGVTRLNGYTPEEHYANPLLSMELIYSEDLERLTAIMEEPAKFLAPVEVRWQHKNGSVVWAEQRHVPIFDGAGNCVTVVGVTRDITARRHTEEQLRQLSLAVEQSPVSITITDIDGNIEYVNPKFTDVTGFTSEDVLGRKSSLLTDADGATKKPRQLMRTLLSGTEWRGELKNRTKTGEPYWESGVISPIVDAQGHVTHFLAVMEDVTQRKQQERERESLLAVTLALREANDRDEMLTVFMQELTTTLDAGKTFFIAPDQTTGEIVVEAVYEFEEFRRTSGIRIAPGKGVAARVCKTSQPYITDDALNDPAFALPDMLGNARAVACVPLISQEKTIGLFSIARQAPWTPNDIRLIFAIADMAASGLERAALHEDALRHAAGLEREIAAHTRELREANMRLQELDKLKSKFVSDVSHELRTPVTNVSLYLKLLRRRPEKQEHYLQVLEEQSARLETLVLEVLDLARLDDKPEVATSLVDLNELLATVVAAQQAKAENRNLRLSFHPNQSLPPVYGDANKLMQVATNLVANALNYTPSGYVQLCTYAEAPNRVSFDVADSGTGIYPEDMPHLYERFYRGRRDRVSDVPGSGLGLSIVKELIELQGGSICVESKVGVGTTFTVTLPAASPAETLQQNGTFLRNGVKTVG